jgi:membrane glycosyltransferase
LLFSWGRRCWIAEELRWDALRRELGAEARLFYRHRRKNLHRKCGNIRDFCENWGALYDYMVVFDADSLMTGETLLELTRRMDADPRAALIQVPPQSVGRASLFARMQQFAGSVYGPLYAAGLAFLFGADGNYWGHNAIIRVQPFMRHCGLPDLPGRAPLGGEILSHDFVEAALLRKAGWKVLMAADLAGSYEEPPPSIIDHLKRDRRWCEGNLQHIRLIFAAGFRAASRVHFATGAMSYLSAPLLLLLLLTFGSLEAYQIVHIAPVTYVGRYPVLAFPKSYAGALSALIVATATLLYGPKLLAYLVLARNRAALAAHGGAGKAALSIVLEAVFSTLLAPVLILSHSGFVLSILLGQGAAWGAQQRYDRRPSWLSVIRLFAPHTIFAVAMVTGTLRYIPGNYWLLPLLVGLALSIPLVYLTSVAEIGRWAQRHGLFVIPSETQGLPILRRVHEVMSARAASEHVALRGDGGGMESIQRLIENRFVVKLHLALLRDAPSPEDDRHQSPALLEIARRGELGAITSKGWSALLSDSSSVAALHRRQQGPPSMPIRG